MSSAFLHTSVYHWAKSTSMSVICSTCFLSCAISVFNPLQMYLRVKVSNTILCTNP